MCIQKPLTPEHFEEFFKLLPDRASGKHSWHIPAEELKAKNYDLKAINPNRKQEVDTRSPEELFSTIEAQGAEISKALIALGSKGI